MTEQNNESKEAAKQSAFVVYRENDLFGKYSSQIIDELKAQGCEVQTKTFPAGTPEKEIEQWSKENEGMLKDKIRITDGTVSSALYKANKIDESINLDDLMNSATTRAISGDETFANKLREELYKDPSNPEKKQEYLAELGVMYKRILTAIPEEKRKALEIIILKGLQKDFPTLIAHENFRTLEDFDKETKETEEFAENMKRWFQEAGISNIETFSTGAEIPMDSISKLVHGKAYIVFDRHTSTSNSNLTPKGKEMRNQFWGQNLQASGLIENKSALRTPIETFYADAKKKIGFPADEQKMEGAIKEIIKNELTRAT